MPHKSFKKILIPNRGEIALRVLHAAKELGYRTAVAYSEADADSLPVQMADESYLLKGNEVAETYLDISKILAIAKEAGADGIHPGYGFLAENPDFAEQCRRAGVKFIGPSPEAMRRLGDKIAAKQLARQAKVSVLPGYDGKISQGRKLQEVADEIGYPILIKAAAGGGGKGMRVVQGSQTLAEEVAAARREGKAYFGDDRVFLEKYLPEPRHIEVQILGDEAGQVVHLFERECSIQRRHQKMMEESPSPSIGDSLRQQICEAAVRIAREADYHSLGTIEFLVDSQDRFFFLEANTRLQVEHPLTEWVTGIDLVKAQFKVAEGHRLPFVQEDILQRGHAIECRLYAEDPENSFLPSEGVVGLLREPARPGVRIDSALREGQKVLPLYDPLLAKLTVYGANRKEALIKMETLLKDYVALGFRHNLDFLRFILHSEPFIHGRYHTHTAQEILERFLKTRRPPQGIPGVVFALGALNRRSPGPMPMSGVGKTPELGPWQSLQGFRNA